MGKLDDLIKAGGSNVAESMGARGAAGPPPGMDPTMARRMPARLEGVARDKDAARIGIERIAPTPASRGRNSTRNPSSAWPIRSDSAASSSRSACVGMKARAST